MSTQTQTYTLAFLAARSPAAYPAAAICQRLNDSGMLDSRATLEETEEALRILQRNGYVQSEVEPVGTRIYWNATPAGLTAWHSAGRIYIGR